EGLAEFYSTFEAEYDKGHSMLGRPMGYRTRSLATQPYIPLREIVSPRDMNEIWHSPDRINMFYAEAWALVHYVSVERKGSSTKTPLADYLKALATNASQDEAFLRAFGVDVNGMDLELRQYIRRRIFGGFRIQRSADAAIRVAEPVLEADVRE